MAVAASPEQGIAVQALGICSGHQCLRPHGIGCGRQGDLQGSVSGALQLSRVSFSGCVSCLSGKSAVSFTVQKPREGLL